MTEAHRHFYRLRFSSFQALAWVLSCESCGRVCLLTYEWQAVGAAL